MKRRKKDRIIVFTVGDPAYSNHIPTLKELRRFRKYLEKEIVLAKGDIQAMVLPRNVQVQTIDL